jgi:N-glycosylase/DNA lyase
LALGGNFVRTFDDRSAEAHLPIIALMSLQPLPAPCFDLEKTLNSGQVFHWVRQDGGFAGAIAEELAYIEQDGRTLFFSGADEHSVVHYLALDHPLDEILNSFPDDPAMKVATEYSAGIRIIRQEPWECLATFLTSAMKQVLHIRAISFAIRQRFGRLLRSGDLCAFSYPRPEVLATARLEQLLECKLGFRARNLLSAARMVASGEIDLEAIRESSTEEARRALVQFPGVGEKIANCVLLFAYERLDAIPIDVWIARVLNEVYFKGRQKISKPELKTFAENYFGSYAGYAQQYLFHHWRLTYRKKG